MTPPEPLEDDFTWVLRKALKSRNLAPTEAAEHAGLPPAEVLALSRGRFSAATARRVAPALGLDPGAFATLPDYHPQIDLPAGLARLAIPYDDGFVNAWLMHHDATMVLIDTGPAPAALEKLLAPFHPASLDVFITHSHHDHVGGLAALRHREHRLHAPAAAGIQRASSLTPGQHLACGPFAIDVLDLDGHCHGALGFLLAGLGLPVCAVGDAVFAGSVGGTPDPRRHALALDRIRRAIMTLPDPTILLPGHGPPTTVALERRHNPFLA